MYQQTPVSELNDTMAKERVVPKYELMSQDMTYGRETFMMRVTCPLTSSGSPVTAYGRYCGTEKAAKHSAALAFIEKFLRRENSVEYAPPQVYRSREVEEYIYLDKLEELETICYDNYLDYPTFYDVSADGPQHYLTWTIECYVSDYVTEGKGRRKVQARTQAIRRMIKLLTDETAHDDEIISSSDDPKGYQPDDENCSFDGGKSNLVHAGNKSVDNCGDHDPTPIERPKAGAQRSRPITSSREDLETFCFKNDFEQPTYWTMGKKGPEHCLTWTMECRVADFVAKGTGKRKSEAKEEAKRRMMEKLTKETESYYDKEIVSSSGDPKGYQPKDQNCVFGGEKSESKSPDHRRSASVQQDVGVLPLAEAPGACRSPNTAETLLKWLKDQKKDSEAREGQYDPGTDLKPKDLNEDYHQEIVSCPDTDARDCIDSGVESSSSPDPPRQLTRLQAVSGINRILRTFERALHENILGALIHTDLPYRATVRILCQEYVVFVKQDLPPMIFEEHYECSDQSIRVACLTRLLLDLMDRIMQG